MNLYHLFILSSLIVIVITDTITPIKLRQSIVGKTHTSDEAKWKEEAIEKLWKERKNMGHTPIVKFSPKGFPNADIVFKNETASPTKTLKHRFVWALLMWAIVEGKLNSKSTVYDSTSGNTGSSEAYMCKLVDLPYVAIVAYELEKEKADQIQGYGGEVFRVDASLRNYYAAEHARENSGYFINQFGNADKAEEFHESGGYGHESTNVFHETVAQLKKDDTYIKKIPDYFVHNAGTGGTISSVGRYVKRYGLSTKTVLSDSEFSLFYDYVVHNKFTNESGKDIWVKPGVAGTGYGYDIKPITFGQTTSLVRSVIDESVKMPDIATTAAMHVLRRRGIEGGASTALNFLVALHKAYQHRNDKERLLVATLICDPANFYESTYYNVTWVDKVYKTRGGNNAVGCWMTKIDLAIENGTDFLNEGLEHCTPKRVRL